MNQQPSRALCLWPGLAGLWLRGQWSSLILAAAFSLLLNLALATSFVWPELMGSRFSLVVWPILAITWTVSFWITWKTLDRFAESPQKPSATDDTLFIQAQTEYLKEDWALCQQILVRQLHEEPRDLESRLLLATTLRRLGSVDAANHQLVMLQRIDGWQSWQTEINDERALLDCDRENIDKTEIDNPEESKQVGIADNDKPVTGQTTTEAGFVRLGKALKLSQPDSDSTVEAPNESTTLNQPAIPDQHNQRAA